MQAVVAPAFARYREALPGVELAPPLPVFLRRENFIELTASIVAGGRNPLLTRQPAQLQIHTAVGLDPQLGKTSRMVV